MLGIKTHKNNVMISNLLKENKLLSVPAADNIIRLAVDSFSDSSIDMLVQAFTVTNDWSEFLKIKEELAVSIIEIVEANNAGFAFPSQSLYVESFPNEKSEIFNPKNTK